jgi:preprotein translocase subunit SecA
LAKLVIEEGNHYSVLESGKQVGQTVINDLQTGVEQMNTQWSEGLQQFVHLKHTNKLCEESLKAIFMSNYIFFKQYGFNIFGMTGTLGAKLEMDLLSNAYSLDFYQLPRFKKELNIRKEPVLL